VSEHRLQHFENSCVALTPKRTGTKISYKGMFNHLPLAARLQFSTKLYQGTRQAYLLVVFELVLPGKHVIRGKAKYRLVDEQVRVFVAPSIEDIVNSEVVLCYYSPFGFESHAVLQLKPYVSTVKLDKGSEHEVLGKISPGWDNGEHC